jgi:DNA-binding MarR family transcriptional regulator
MPQARQKRSITTSISHTDVDVVDQGMEQSSRSVNREDVAEALEQAAILVVRHMSDRAALNLTTSMVLDTLNREGPVRVTTLAAAAGIGQPSMTELVQRLERQRLVTRVDDPEDGRAALVTITDAGRAPLDDQRRARRDRLAELLTALPAEDEAALTLAMHVALPIIGRLIHNAHASRTQAAADRRARVTLHQTSRTSTKARVGSLVPPNTREPE